MTPEVPELRTRVARVSERSRLEELQRRASLANEGDREALLAHPDAIRLPMAQLEARQVFVAERSGLLLGFSAVLDRLDGDTELDGLFVEPDAWRGGVGTHLVARAVRYAADHGAASLHVIGNPHAAEFYEACGFTAYGATETEFGSGTLLRLPVDTV